MMTEDTDTSAQSPLQAVQQAVGPYFLWVRLENELTHFAYTDDLVFEQAIPGGLQVFIEPLAQSLMVPASKAVDFLHLSGFYQSGIQRIVEPGLNHLSNGISQMVESLMCHGRTLQTVVLDEPTGPIPGLAEVVQGLWPTYRIVSLRSLGIASPNRIPLGDEDAEAAGIVEAVEDAPIPDERFSSQPAPIQPTVLTTPPPVVVPPLLPEPTLQPSVEVLSPVVLPPLSPVTETAAPVMTPDAEPPRVVETRVLETRVASEPIPAANGGSDPYTLAEIADTRARNRASSVPRILIAEEDTQMSSFLQLLLEREGFEVLVAADGRQAVSIFNENDPTSLVLLDISLPYVSGVQLISHIRSKREWDDVPIVVLSAASQEGEIVRALDAGANDYVVKPISPEELMARLRRLMKFAAARR